MSLYEIAFGEVDASALQVEPLGLRSILKPVSLEELSVQPRAIEVEPVLLAVSPDGAEGGTSLVVALALLLKLEYAAKLNARTR